MGHVYKSIRALEQKKTVLFVAFDNEEKGLVGARAMANALAKEDLPRYCAMINIDSFGLAQPFAMANTSSRSLIRAAEESASILQVPFNSTPITGADADSSAFLGRKIPAVTFAGIGSDWPSILHTVKDQKEKVDARSVYVGYRLALAVWDRVDQAACDAFRE
jgi:Zn-dependent M28 family amino/carboxypeptidase